MGQPGILAPLARVSLHITCSESRPTVKLALGTHITVSSWRAKHPLCSDYCTANPRAGGRQELKPWPRTCARGMCQESHSSGTGPPGQARPGTRPQAWSELHSLTQEHTPATNSLHRATDSCFLVIQWMSWHKDAHGALSPRRLLLYLGPSLFPPEATADCILGRRVLEGPPLHCHRSMSHYP